MTPNKVGAVGVRQTIFKNQCDYFWAKKAKKCFLLASNAMPSLDEHLRIAILALRLESAARGT